MSKHKFFTKRALLTEFAIVTFALFLLLYMMVPKYIQQQSERYAIQQIKEYGGFITYDENDKVIEVKLVFGNDENGNRIDIHNQSDEIIKVFPRFKHLKQVMIHGEQASDNAMEHIGKIKTLEHLFMWGAAVSDEGIENLSNLKQLQSIHCKGSDITDKSLQILSQLPELKSLSLQQNAFSDNGLSYLKDMTQIEILWVDLGTSTITDEGVKHLVNLKNLKTLALQKTNITDECIETVKQLPKLEKSFIDETVISDEAKIDLLSVLPNIRIDPAPKY